MRAFLTILSALSMLSGIASAWELPFPASRFDQAYDVGIMPGGDVVSAGVIAPTNASRVSDYAVTRLDAVTGAQIWRTTIDGPATNDQEDTTHRTDAAFRVAFTSGGDVVAYGTLADAVTNHYVVVRLNGATGAELWRATIFADDPLSCCGGGEPPIVVDAADDVLMAFHGHVRKLDGDTGAQLWSIDDPDLAPSVAVDSAGNAFVCGIEEVRSVDGATGGTIWSAPQVGRWFGTVVVDAQGNVIAGGHPQPFFNHSVIVKFAAANGAVLWQASILTSGGSPITAGFGELSLALDAANDVFVTGNVGEGYTSGVLKLSGSNGLPLWDSAETRFRSLAIAPNGDAFTNNDGFRGNLYRIDGATGAFIWKQTAFTTGSRYFGGDAGHIAVMADGTPVVPSGRDLKSKASGGVVTAYSGELTGRSLVVNDKVGVPAASKLVVSSTDPTNLIPWPGGPSDPVTVGGQLELRNPVTNESAVFPLPAASWQNTTPPALATKDLYTYRYSDGHGVNGPCTKVELRGGKSLKATCRGAGIGFTLDEATQGVLEVRLTIGTIKHCMRFGGTVKSDRPGSFKATNAGPGDCQ
ncbi:MAG TPA: PQQ-binding-like beta-propeller repeat protein [Candidatus Binatia bacterium]|nr:PQQ-binding-like beta-propeller repeat protein [Candidatus Binatia bacterium]